LKRPPELIFKPPQKDFLQVFFFRTKKLPIAKPAGLPSFSIYDCCSENRNDRHQDGYLRGNMRSPPQLSQPLLPGFPPPQQKFQQDPILFKTNLWKTKKHPPSTKTGIQTALPTSILVFKPPSALQPCPPCTNPHFFLRSGI